MPLNKQVKLTEMAEKQSIIRVFNDTRDKIKHLQRMESAHKDTELSIPEVVRDLVEEKLKSREADSKVVNINSK